MNTLRTKNKKQGAVVFLMVMIPVYALIVPVFMQEKMLGILN